jgi:hypothetical protein
MNGYPCACADCGEVFEIACLTFCAARLLCAVCLHEELNTLKKDAEVWLLERMYVGSSASAGGKAAA